MKSIEEPNINCLTYSSTVHKQFGEDILRKAFDNTKCQVIIATKSQISRCSSYILDKKMQ